MIENNVMIFGITGQDGSYLAVHLSKLGYNVIGVRRSTSTDNLSNLRRVQVLESFDCLLNKIKLEHGDVTDPISVSTLISRYKPYKIFNLAAQSHVGISFETPLLTANVDGIGTLNILEAIKMHSPKSRFYQASTSELFGGQSKMKLDENSIFDPRSPYAAAKMYAYNITKIYRNAYQLYSVNGILFNHESPLRGKHFVTQKIINGLVKKVFSDKSVTLKLGNIYSARDWGHARDYVKAMNLMLDQENPEDLVIGTGVVASVKEFCELVSSKLGIRKFEWRGEGLNEKLFWLDSGYDNAAIAIDPLYFRPLEVNHLDANPEYAIKKLTWKPECNLETLVDEMLAEVKHEHIQTTL